MSILLQKKICKKCDSEYNLSSYLTIIPILIVLLMNCSTIQEYIFIFSLGCAIGRIGCFFAGCCTGKESTSFFSLKYENSLVNKKLNKKIVYVEPTIIIEIILQFIITYIIYNNKTGYIYYGIMMSILLYLTNLWRRVPRLGKITDSNITIFSLLLTSIISYVKCNNNDNNKLNINFNIFNNNYLKNIIIGIISIFFGLCASNDININLLTKIKNEF